MLHEADAPPLDRVRQNQRRLSECKGRAVQSMEDLPVIVTINFAHGPTEGAPLVRKGLEVEHLRDRAEALDLVVIDQAHEVIEPVMRRKQDRFPVRALIALPIAEKCINTVRSLVRLARQ